jgi:hypothetical protein
MTATTVAARGALAAEITWSMEGGVGDHLDSQWAAQGTKAVASVLAGIGGVPSRPAPDGHRRTPLTRLAAALPRPSWYGAGMKPWPAPATYTRQNQLREGPPRDHDLTCGYIDDHEGAPGGVPTVTRALLGSVAVREDLAITADEDIAERVRRGMLHRHGESEAIDDLYMPCARDYRDPTTDQPQLNTVHRKVERFQHGHWNGEIETMGARLAALPDSPTSLESVAHVAVSVRHATAVYYMRWQTPAGTDLNAAIAQGRAQVTRTLKALSHR